MGEKVKVAGDRQWVWVEFGCHWAGGFGGAEAAADGAGTAVPDGHRSGGGGV